MTSCLTYIFLITLITYVHTLDAYDEVILHVAWILRMRTRRKKTRKFSQTYIFIVAAIIRRMITFNNQEESLFHKARILFWDK